MTEEQKKRCHEIADHYGMILQTQQTLQEMSELAVLLTRRNDQIMKCIEKHFKDMQSEIADCMIMMEQMAYLVGRAEVNAEIERKLDRQMRSLNAPQAASEF